MNTPGDEIRELVESLYAAIDHKGWSMLEEVVSPRVVVEVGSAPSCGAGSSGRTSVSSPASRRRAGRRRPH